MARTYTRTQICGRAKRRVDYDRTTSPIADTTWNEWFEESYTWLYDLLVSSGLAYQESTQTITTTAGTQTYALPSDFYGTVRLDFQVDSNTYDRIPLIGTSEVPNLDVSQTERALGYRVVGSNVALYPTPSVSSKTYRHVYIPAPGKFTADSDTVDGVSGWEQLLICDMAIKARIFDESDTGALERERAMLVQRIEEMRQARLGMQSHHIGDSNDDVILAKDPADWRYRRVY